MLGLLLTGISTAFSVRNQLQQGKTAMKIAEYNNKLAEAEARNVEAETTENIKRARISQRGGMATLKARLSNTGLRSGTGTALSIVGDTAARYELSIADAARAAGMEAQSLRQKGAMGLWEGKMAKQAARNAAIGTAIQGATQIVSSFGHNRYS